MIGERALAGLCISLLLAPAGWAQASTEKVRAEVQALPAGTPVKVKLRNHDVLRGRLAGASDSGFALQVAQDQRVEVRTLAFNEVQSVRKAADRHKRFTVAGWTLLGVATASIVVAVTSIYH
jgi:hypothetical protein